MEGNMKTLYANLLRVTVITLFLATPYSALANPITASCTTTIGPDGCRDVYSQIYLTIRDSQDSPGTEVFNKLLLDNSSTGRTFMAVPTSPAYTAFVYSLTHVPHYFITFSDLGGSGGGGSSSYFSNFHDGSGNIVDLYNWEINSLSLHIDSICIDTPGSDLNHDGHWTDLTLVTTITVNAVPEPCSLILLGIGAISLLGYWWRRRK